MDIMGREQLPLWHGNVQRSCCIGFGGTIAQTKVPLHHHLKRVQIGILLDLSHEADGLIYVFVACADLTIAAGQLRQAIADTFVFLAESWELGKKFSGECAVKYAGSLNIEIQHP